MPYLRAFLALLLLLAIGVFLATFGGFFVALLVTLFETGWDVVR